eukprot:Rmarinus@m.12399
MANDGDLWALAAAALKDPNVAATILNQFGQQSALVLPHVQAPQNASAPQPPEQHAAPIPHWALPHYTNYPNPQPFPQPAPPKEPPATLKYSPHIQRPTSASEAYPALSHTGYMPSQNVLPQRRPPLPSPASPMNKDSSSLVGSGDGVKRRSTKSTSDETGSEPKRKRKKKENPTAAGDGTINQSSKESSTESTKLPPQKKKKVLSKEGTQAKPKKMSTLNEAPPTLPAKETIKKEVEQKKDEGKFPHNHVVWAKVKMQSWWPCIVRRDAKTNASHRKGKYHCWFFIEEAWRWVPEQDLMDYVSNISTLKPTDSRKLKRNRLGEAIELADKAVAAMAEGAPFSMSMLAAETDEKPTPPLKRKRAAPVVDPAQARLLRKEYAHAVQRRLGLRAPISIPGT